jgi:enoyl-CoA hydratase/carnithine racemase
VAEILIATDAHGIRTVSINREEKRNALDRATCSELEAAFVEAHTDDAVRVVVLRGAGDRAFCAGADLSQLLDHASIEESRTHFDGVARVIRAMQSCRAPVIARVPDFALAGGMGLAVAADFTIAAAGARFGLPEIGLGLLPLMVSAPIYRALGSRKRLLDLVLTGRTFAAEEALTHDLVTRVVPPQELDSAVAALAEQLAGLSPTAVAIGKEAIYTLCEMEEAGSLRYLRDAIVLTSLSEDAQEGIRAFFEKRKPVWSGR